MNGIVLGCLIVMCLVGTITAQTSGAGAAGSNAGLLAASRMFGGSGGGGNMMSRLFPLLAITGGGNDAMLPLLMCNGQNRLMCMLALSQGGIM